MQIDRHLEIIFPKNEQGKTLQNFGEKKGLLHKYI